MTVVDIGANFGIYTLTMAKNLGNSGRIWSFEPASTTAAFLAGSIEDNNLGNVHLVKAGLSDRLGSATLYLSRNSEMNSLTRHSSSGERTETVPLLTLDRCREDFNWENIDFIKLDAEGEEVNILRGGERLLADLSPIVMAEYKHGRTINTELIGAFEAFGYHSYRLVPGVGTLVPLSAEEPADSFLLNIFFCKDDKARKLEDEDIIVTLRDAPGMDDYSPIRDHLEHAAYTNATGLTALAGTSTRTRNDYLDMLAAYLRSCSSNARRAERTASLFAALDIARAISTGGERSITRLTTCARVAMDAGERGLGLSIVAAIFKLFHAHQPVNISEPFLPACPRYDRIDPGSRTRDWLFSSAVELWMRKHSYTSYISGDNSIPAMEELRGIGFLDEDTAALIDFATTAIASGTRGTWKGM
jgi:protein O-GlcNAc transferase